MDKNQEGKQRSLEQRLAAHPQLRAHVEELLDEVENRAGKLDTADDAEDALVARVRALGCEALARWAQQREASVQPTGDAGLRRGGKKNSGG